MHHYEMYLSFFFIGSDKIMLPRNNTDIRKRKTDIVLESIILKFSCEFLSDDSTLIHSANLTTASLSLERLELGIDNTTQRKALATNALADLRVQAEELRDEAGDMKAKATKLQERNVEGQCCLFTVELESSFNNHSHIT